MTARVGSSLSPARSTTSTPPARCGWPAREAVSLWHADADLKGVDAVVVPGGFSYGDYLRCGAIARFAPVMGEVVAGRRRAACRCWVSATASRCCAKRACCPAR